MQVDNGEQNYAHIAHQSTQPTESDSKEEICQSVLMLGRYGVIPGRIVTLLRQNHNGMAAAQDIFGLRHA